MFWTNYTFVRWNLAWCTGCQDRRPLHILRLLVPLSDEVPDSARLSNLKHSLQRVSIPSMAQTIHFINPTGSGSPSSTVQVATWWNSTEDFSIRATPCPLLEGPIFSTRYIKDSLANLISALEASGLNDSHDSHECLHLEALIVV